MGIFANLRLNGLFYGDFLIYTGSIVLFFSLGLWLLWYLGNVPAPYDPLTGVGKSNSIVELARKISRRLSEKLKTEVMGGSKADDELSEAGTEKLKPGRVTWGKSTAYVNKGYEQDAGESVDGPEDLDQKSPDYNDTVEDEDENEDVKKQPLDDQPRDQEDDDVKKTQPDEAKEESDVKTDENTGDTEETSFER